MPTEALFAIAGFVMAAAGNLAGFAYAYGKLTQKVAEQGRDLTAFMSNCHICPNQLSRGNK